MKDALAREQSAAAGLARREEAVKELAAVKQQEKEAKDRKKELEKELAKKRWPQRERERARCPGDEGAGGLVSPNIRPRAGPLWYARGERPPSRASP